MFKRYQLYTIFCILFLSTPSYPVSFSGELNSTYSNLGNSAELKTISLRYLPSLQLKQNITYSDFIDFEISGYLYSSSAIDQLSDFFDNRKLEFYRYIIRFATPEFECRLGLQKLNFGSARYLRPLQWFDQINPLDPTGFTAGVKGMLLRYFFENNANFWMWTLYDEEFEWGGRYQFPIPLGEFGITYHKQKVFPSDSTSYDETRYGFDGSWDLEIGCWAEVALIQASNQNTDVYRNQLISIGADYTLPVENGIYIMTESMLTRFTTTNTEQKASIISASYSLSLIDSLQLLYSTDWKQAPTYLGGWKATYDDWYGQINVFYQNEMGVQASFTYNH